MTSQEFKRWLQEQGCTFEPGHGGHLVVRRGSRMSVLPMHGKQKDLGAGLVNRIKKNLGLKSNIQGTQKHPTRHFDGLSNHARTR